MSALVLEQPPRQPSPDKHPELEEVLALDDDPAAIKRAVERRHRIALHFHGRPPRPYRRRGYSYMTASAFRAMPPPGGEWPSPIVVADHDGLELYSGLSAAWPRFILAATAGEEMRFVDMFRFPSGMRRVERMLRVDEIAAAAAAYENYRRHKNKWLLHWRKTPPIVLEGTRVECSPEHIGLEFSGWRIAICLKLRRRKRALGRSLGLLKPIPAHSFSTGFLFSTDEADACRTV